MKIKVKDTLLPQAKYGDSYEVISPFNYPECLYQILLYVHCWYEN